MKKLRNIARRIERLFAKPDKSFLSDAGGIIHVGANTGQERELYQHYGLNVIWIEPIPEVFKVLEDNIRDFPLQKAYQYLVTDENDKQYNFNIANNFGKSSSILELNQHKDIWPDVKYEREITLQSIRLPKLLENELIDIKKYNTLIMDTQGSELLVLKGANNVLKHFKYIKTEVCDFESYTGCCQLDGINQFLGENGFKPYSKDLFATREGGGSYYDVTYINNYYSK